ncbi:MAG: hypothetical protein IJ666_00485 [Ruminococcus sp.]|nr:hypothetical protein [Ruminococcus sp.]
MTRACKAVLFAVIFILTLMLTGCHGMYRLDIKADREFSDGKIIDILIPIDKNDDKYIERKTYFREVFKDKKPKYVYDTEIYRYNTDGYRSMICYYPLSDYRISQDNNSADFEIYFNGTYEFKNMCEKYKTFKIAVLDSDGNILSVSQEYGLISKKNCYIKSPLEYNHAENTLSFEYEYKRALWLVFFEFILELTVKAAAFISVIHLLAVILIERNNPKGYHIFIFPVYCVPLVLYLYVRLDYMIHTAQTMKEAWGKLYDEIVNIPLSESLYCAVPYIILVSVAVWYEVRALSKKNK